MIEIGSVIDGKYKILSVIGQGGMSTVYLAINAKANKPWAIKEVRKDGFQNYEVVTQSLTMEIDLLKKLRHPHLPSIIDIIDRDDNFLIVMDYVEGMTLENIMLENGAQSQKDVIEWSIQLCDVLQYLHSREPSIIYRDMKPSNVMLNYDGKVMLIDFGTAREYKERALGDTTCLGTKGYAAPEQFGGQGQSDPRTDIYCLGATMYHLLTGHNPSNAPYEMYPITQWNPELSSGLEKIIQKCTQKNPEDRFQTVEELKDALKNYKDLDTPMIEQAKKSLRVFAILLILTLCCSICFGVSQLQTKVYQINQYETTVNTLEEVKDVSVHATYWRELIELQQQSKSRADREWLELQMYESIVIHATEDVTYLQQNGIELMEILEVLGDIRADIKEMEKSASKEKIEKISSLREQINHAEQVVIASYEEEEAYGSETANNN